jgi:lysophospholipid acyltransferase (LPLAT)-like uncharacterized protein
MNNENVTGPEHRPKKKRRSQWRVFVRQMLRRFGLWGGVRLAGLMLRLLRRTWKVERHGYENFLRRPIIVAFWHGNLLVGATEALAARRRDFGTLTSRSRDGEVAASLARLVRVTPLRGGSSRGQVEALRSMERWLRSGNSLVLAVDGPRGPRGIVKSGIILLASRTGVPIVPAAARFDPKRAWIFHSWDRMWVPRPWARFEVYYGEPMHVPADLDRAGIEKWRGELERSLFVLQGESLAAEGHRSENDVAVRG